MFKLLVTYPNMEELRQVVTMTQATMAETAEAACNAKELLEMREVAKEIPVANEVMDYAMKLVIATQPDSEAPAKVAKKYLRFGASPRAAQALITTAKVRALMHGRFNVSYEDLNVLALPVLRHRIKPNFEAITERVTTDDIINAIIKELNNKGGTTGSIANTEEKADVVVEAPVEEVSEQPIDKKEAKRAAKEAARAAKEAAKAAKKENAGK
mgnify:CR=1 FL=1